MSEVLNENTGFADKEPKTKIPEGSGYESLIKDSEDTILGTTLEKLYPEFVGYLDRHRTNERVSRLYERAAKELDGGNMIVIKALAGLLENELTSSKYRNENLKALRKDKKDYPDPRFPRNKHRKLSAEKKFRIQTGEQIALVRSVRSRLGFTNLNPRPVVPGADYRAEVAVALNDIGVALMKNPLRQMGKVVPFRRTA